MKILQALVLGTFFVIVGALVTLFALGLRPGANSMRSTITVARPPAAVWRWVTEPARLARWVSWLAEVKQDTVTVQGVGSRQTWVLAEPGMRDRVRMTATVAEQDAPHLRRVHVRTPGMFDGDYTYTLTPVDGGTRLEQSVRFHYDVWIARLMEPLVTPQARRTLAGDQATLKRLAETEPEPAGPAGGRRLQ